MEFQLSVVGELPAKCTVNFSLNPRRRRINPICGSYGKKRANFSFRLSPRASVSYTITRSTCQKSTSMAAKSLVIPTPALVLGLAGLIPFLTCALLAWIPNLLTTFVQDSASGFSNAELIQQKAILALGAYGAVILSFLGGIRWGVVVNNKTQVRRWGPLALSVVPSLIAWPALLLPAVWMLSLLAAGFVLQYAADIEAVRHKVLPSWFGRLRTLLTSGAVIALLAGLLAAAFN